MELHQLSAASAAKAIASKKITSEALVKSCLARITLRDQDIHAWASIDREFALEQARARDRERAQGPLHGVPIGIKDIIDTVDLPTEYNSPIYRGHRPAWDSACVALTKAAGGVILGKTVTTEFAYRYTGATRNPHDLECTPGGSSSGSAAAVADFMVPIALGTQTGGSTIRPASYCGIVGYKPSFNLINRAGTKPLAETLDTIGILARTVEDVALYAHAVTGITMIDVNAAETKQPRVGICRTSRWDQGDAATHESLESAALAIAKAGAKIAEMSLGKEFDQVYEDHAVIIDYEAARALSYEYHAHHEKLSELLIQNIEKGLCFPRERYELALARAGIYRRLLEGIFEQYDFLLTPSAPGEAPLGIQRAGDSVFNRIWTLFGTPCVTLPYREGPRGLPIGIQLIGGYAADERLLSWAEWTRRALIVPS